ncbi:MAG: nicotinate-nicotinamide nucleotide adenylyltransferase [Rhodospirillales bacterium]|nr:nicotinate-nicotinamide nucleotide adenylyltransferase [Rhodospirillales bacterium]
MNRTVSLARRRGQRIGLLGGSFNPAHAGHRWISTQALARLALDEVWWLISPQNPLKGSEGMRPFAERVKTAQEVADHPRILVSDLEDRLGTIRTHATLARLRRRLPGARLVWLMGGDLPPSIHLWEHWRRIFRTTGIAVLARPPYARPALTSMAFRRYRMARVRSALSVTLASRRPPVWTYLEGPRHPASGTALRAQRQPSVPPDHP